MASKLTLSTLYRREYLYKVEPSDTTLTPFTILFKALSQRDLDFTRTLEDPSQYEINLIILQKSLVRFYNVITEDGNPVTAPDLSLLNVDQINTIGREIHKVSAVTYEVLQKIKLNTALSIEDKFSTPTWECELCRHKGLDTQRNCKYRDDYDELYKDDLSILVGGENYDHCPMYYKDDQMTSDIFSCYNALEKGVLPEFGGTIDQTEFFLHATNIVRVSLGKRDKKDS